jgi:hypothetical protein
MADRKTLGDAMTPEKIAFIRGSTGKQAKMAQAHVGPKAPEKTIELNETLSTEETETSPLRRRNRGRTRQEQPQASEILDQVLVPVPLRLQHRTAQALRRAYLEQKLKHAKPDTLQDIGEDAIADWLTKSGYLD